jgi:transcriptional regulator
MYIPKKHKAPDRASEIEYIRKNGFATLVSLQSGSPIATHLPLYLHQDEGSNSLWGHIAKGNPQTTAIKDGAEVLAIFMNTHSYVSSSWYDHINVPTWNYIAVHVYGKLKIMEGEALITNMRSLVHKYEDGRQNRYHLEDMPPSELQANLNGIVGFELSMDRVESAFKLSQNRDDQDFKSVVANLKKDGGDTTAEAMIELRKGLFDA